MKEENYIIFVSVLHLANLQGSAVSLDCFTFHHSSVLNTTVSSLNVLEVSREDQHGQDGHVSISRLQTGRMQETLWQL